MAWDCGASRPIPKTSLIPAIPDEATKTLRLGKALIFCGLLLAAFDTQRWRLYEALRWPLPAQSGAEELAAGQALTRFIQRGMMDAPLQWVDPAR